MKVNQNLKNIKKNIKVNVQPIYINPDTNDLINKWNEKLVIVNEILEYGKTNSCYQDIYQKINDLLLYKIPDKINDNFNQLVKFHSENFSKKLVELSLINNFDDFFEKFNNEWNRINENFLLLRKLLIKFEKKFFSKNLSTQTIYSLFIESLRISLRKDMNFLSLISERILYKINEIREFLMINLDNVLKNNNIINFSNTDDLLKASLILEKSNSNVQIISKGVTFLWETGFYKEIFQEYFITNSVNYYKNIANSSINNLKIENYIKFVEITFENETYIINSFLNEFSLKKMINELENNLINEKKIQILEKFFSFNNINQENNTILCEELYLRVNQIEFLKKLYSIFKRIKIEDEIKNSWINYINVLCNKIYSQHSKNYMIFMQNIFELKKNIDNTIKESFNSDDKMKSAGRDGFVKSINLKPNFIADYFARYIDHILTESGREKQDIFNKIDEFMLIFRHLENKDMFEGFYIKRLSYRLLYNLTNFKEGESYLIEKLKCECGSVFVTKAEEMIQDIEASVESTLNFHGKNKDNLEYNFYVLSSNSWPLSTKAHEGYISSKVCELQKNYTDYYNTKNSRKVLKWHLPFCTAELNFKHKNRQSILEVNGVQCAILYVFNNNENYQDDKSITLKKILEVSFLDKEVVINAIKNLTKNVPILIKVQDSYTEAYKINDNVTLNKSKICINDFSNREEVAVEEIIEVEERNHEERKFVVDCLIMKVLKHKKQMVCDDILHEVIGLLKFTCETSLILTRLNNLVTNKYIVMDEKDENLYRYC